jgi:hypothetical protein
MSFCILGFLIASSFFCQGQRSEGLVVCAGGKELFIMEAGGPPGVPFRKIWSWSAESSKQIKADEVRKFANLDECKPVDGGKAILFCASNSGCGLIEYPSGKVVWSAFVTNAHSVELLPGGRIAAASSLGGNQLLLFDTRGESPGEPVWKAPLHSAHGVVWDAGRETLWALGFDELRQYKLKDWSSSNPSLDLQKTHPLPSEGGHDLRPVPETADLLVTNHAGVFLFDRDAGKFRPHPVAGPFSKVKSIDVDEASGRVVYSTWGRKIELLSPPKTLSTSENIVYKARWFPGKSDQK